MHISLEPSPFPRKGLVYTLFTHAHALDFTLFREKSMIGQWVGMRFYDKLAHAKNSVYQALIYFRKAWVRGLCAHTFTTIQDMLLDSDYQAEHACIMSGSGNKGKYSSQSTMEYPVNHGICGNSILVL